MPTWSGLRGSAVREICRHGVRGEEDPAAHEGAVGHALEARRRLVRAHLEERQQRGLDHYCHAKRGPVGRKNGRTGSRMLSMCF